MNGHVMGDLTDKGKLAYVASKCLLKALLRFGIKGAAGWNGDDIANLVVRIKPHMCKECVKEGMVK